MFVCYGEIINNKFKANGKKKVRVKILNVYFFKDSTNL